MKRIAMERNGTMHVVERPTAPARKDFDVLLANGYTVQMRALTLKIVGPKQDVQYQLPMTADERSLLGDLLTGKLP